MNKRHTGFYVGVFGSNKKSTKLIIIIIIIIIVKAKSIRAKEFIHLANCRELLVIKNLCI
ncbi:MAG: hypothetical protein MRQ08_04555 [Candidatus Midichloria mitochondrii]|nr:hypothetical protein [Candidatus Midichloria mitochondrii]